MHSDEDRDLKGLFNILRDEERGEIPAFQILMARAREEALGLEEPTARRALRPHPRKLVWGGSLLAAAAAAVLIFLPPRGTSEAEFVQVVQMFSADPASGAWKSPTDALLDVPGSEMLSTIPSVGSRTWLLEPNNRPPRNEL